LVAGIFSAVAVCVNVQVAAATGPLDGPRTTVVPGVHVTAPVVASGTPAVNVVPAQAVPARPVPVALRLNTPGSSSPLPQVPKSGAWQAGVSMMFETVTFSTLFWAPVELLVIVNVTVTA